MSKKYFKKVTLNDFSINNNAIIEASAGTGKTYTIERLVVQILLEKNIDIEKILAVTFTEKATGELRFRIRNLIEKLVYGKGDDVEADEISNYILLDNQAMEILEKALFDFERAGIYTIHGFCNKIITEYPFETGSYFANKIVDDLVIFPKIFSNYIRKVFINNEENKNLLSIYFKHTPGLNTLDTLQTEIIKFFFKKGIYKPDYKSLMNDLFDKVIPIKNAYHSILSEHNKDSLTELFLCLEQTHEKLFAKAYPYKEIDLAGNKNLFISFQIIDEFFRDLNFNNNKNINSFELISLINSLAISFDIIDARKPLTKSLKEFLKQLNNLQKEYNIQTLLLLKILTTEDNHSVSLYNYFQTEKRRMGVTSYNDMIDVIARAVENGNNGLTENLKRKYDYAIIDEFQDTDKKQWAIFSQIFLNDSSKKIFIIGDPKQAIYAFRGGDVHTYEIAKQQLNPEKLPQPGLTVNQRSSPGLVEGVQFIFNAAPFTSNNNEKFSVLPKVTSARSDLVLHSSDKKSSIEILVLDSKDKIKAPIYKNELAAIISNKIRLLIDNDSYTYFDGRRNPKNEKFQPSDIAILCYSFKEAGIIKSSLISAGIPCTIYKQKGLFQTTEAEEIVTLLKAVASPYNHSLVKRALHTLFFNYSLQEIKLLTDNSIGDEINSQIMFWHKLAIQRNFEKLFSSILKETAIVSRLLLFKNGERQITNLEHIFEELLKRIKENRFNIEDVVLTLEDLINNNDENTGEDLLRLETEKNAVQIMTIHAAKGLEFPVVFIYGGFSGSKFKSYTYHEDNEKYIDLSEGKISGKTDLIKKETEEENYNLLYVAMTRAKLKLYLPFVVNPSQKINGKFSPFYDRINSIKEKDEPALSVLKRFNTCSEISLEIFNVSEISQKSINSKPVPVETIIKNLPELSQRFLHKIPDSFKEYTRLFVPNIYENLKIKKEHLNEIVDLYSTLNKDINNLELLVYLKNLLLDNGYNQLYENYCVYRNSFSRLNTEIHNAHLKVNFEDESDELDDDLLNEIKDSENILPPGINTGETIHEIFEEIDFDKVKNSENPAALKLNKETVDIIRKAMRKHGFDENNNGLFDCFLKNVYYTLTSQLTAEDENLKSFRLCDIRENCKKHETEFYLPYLKNVLYTDENSRSQNFQEITNGKGFFFGKIDMIFSVNSRYYFLDWKSNSIPSGKYNDENIMKIMKESGYTLQYQLYTLAMVHWLLSHFKNQPPYAQRKMEELYNDKFGGLFYVFTRAMESNKTGTGSVFYKKPDWNEIIEWEIQLLKKNPERSFINA